MRSLKGVGPKVEGLLNKLLAPRHEGAHARVIDLVVAFAGRGDRPRRRAAHPDAKIGELATLEVTVTEHRPGGGGRRRGRAALSRAGRG